MTLAALFVAVLLLLANAFFVGAEFGLIAARRTRLEQLAAEGDHRARVALSSARELSLMLSGAQLGITMASLGLGYVAEPAVAKLLEGPLALAGLGEGAAHSVALVVGLTIVVFLHMLIGEMVPKNIAIAESERVALLLAVPMRAYTSLFRPVVRALTVTANTLVRLLRVEPRDELMSAHTADEFARLLAASRQAGMLEEFEHELLTSALGFTERQVGEVMVPLERVVTVPATSTPASVEKVAVERGHSRLPVYGRNPADILGFVHAKDLLDLDPASRHRPLPGRLIRRMLVVRHGDDLQGVLLAMQRARRHFALVVDDVGRAAGVATIADLLEELVGEVREESPPGRD